MLTTSKLFLIKDHADRTPTVIITKLISQDEHFFQGWNEFNSCVNVEFHFKGIASVMVVFLQVFIFKSNYDSLQVFHEV